MSKKNIAGLTVEIGGDTTKLSKALESVDRQSSSLSKELGEINKLLKMDPGNTELLAQKQKVLSEAIENTKTRLETLKKAQEEAAEAAKGGNAEAEETMRALEREIIATEQKLRGYESAAEETGKTIDELGKETEDTAESQKELAKKTEESAKQLEEQKDKAREARKELADLAEKGADKAAAGIAAIATAAVGAATALGALVLKEAANADELGDLSTKTGLSVEQLQKYRYAAEMAGTSLDVVTGAHAKLIKNMATASKGTGDAAAAFEKLGIKITDANGELRDSDEVFGELLDTLGSMENETERDALAMQIFGKSAQELNPLIKAGSEGIAAYNKEAEELGAIVSDETVGALVDLQSEVKRVKAQFSALKQNVAAEFAPVVTKIVVKFQELIKKAQDQISKPKVKQAIEKLGTALANFIDKGVDAAIKLLPTLAKAVEFLVSNMKALIIVLGTLYGVFKGVSVVLKVADAFTTVTKALEAMKTASLAAKTAQEGLEAASKAASLSVGGWVAILGAVGVALAAFVKSGIDHAKQHIEDLTGTSKRISESVQETAESMNAARQQYDDTIASSEAAAAVAQRYVERLKALESQSKLTADQQREYNMLVDMLNEAMPGLNAQIDENTGRIKGGTRALEEHITQLKEKIRLEALSDLIKENIKAEIELEKELAEAIENRNAKEEEYSELLDLYEKNKQHIELTNEELMRQQELFDEFDLRSYADVDKVFEAADQAVQDATKALEANRAEAERLTQAYQDVSVKMYSYGESWGDGIIKGIRRKTPEIAREATISAQAISRAFANTLQIRSPSRIAFKYGGFWDEGFIGGVDKKLPDMKREMAVAANALSSTFEEGLNPANLPNPVALDRSFATTRSAAASSASSSLGDRLDRILAAIEAGQILTIDSRALVGATVGQYDEALAVLAAAAGRGKA